MKLEKQGTISGSGKIFGKNVASDSLETENNTLTNLGKQISGKNIKRTTKLLVRVFAVVLQEINRLSK